MKNNIKISIPQLENYYKIYCNKTLNPKNRMFKTFEEFSYIITRADMSNCLKDFRRKTCNVSKIHQQAKFMLMFSDREGFADIDPDNIIPKCSTLEATLRLCKNKHMEDILHE